MSVTISYTVTDNIRTAASSFMYGFVGPGQNGDKPKRRKSKRRHQNGNREVWSKRRKRTKESQILRGSLLIIPQSTTALQLGRLLNGSKQTSKKFSEATATPLHTSGNMNGCVDFLPRHAMVAQYMLLSCVCLCVCVCLSVYHTPVLTACSKCV